MEDASAGGLLLIVAGVMNGSFALPMKHMPRWRWENIWLAWSTAALVVLPLVTAMYFVPHLFRGLTEVPAASLISVMLCGVAWGVAQVLFGLSVAAIGIALTFSLVLGISAAVGAVVPFVSLHAALMRTQAGAYLLLGLLVLSIGMGLCARAGILRDRALGQTTGAKSSLSGLALAVFSGLCASAMNVGFSFSTALTDMAVKHGATGSEAKMVVWFPLLLGGAVPNLLYTAYLLRRNRTASLYGGEGTRSYWVLTAGMALLWFGSTTLYGVASNKLGALGAVLGWPIFMSIVVIMASVLGWQTGEWNGTGSKPLRTQTAGLLMLVVAVLLFSKAAV